MIGRSEPKSRHWPETMPVSWRVNRTGTRVDAKSTCRTPINLGRFYGHSAILTQRRGSFTCPMNRNGARQRPYHALSAASSGFIPTMFSTRVRL